ncbi:uncharacterized protein BJ212DRAFT_1299458 [Suillus subaureus]|uniref:Uncharacterized protein n=1 Tax=Suillus subaureus TaxID=48587 RepID=A0A9P7EB88_9AGAM|nr:uncharacterized protein BJ212DRAFT_1299458 [Suillus subaureus]KAG1816697.1 hypothetical protein BJ212DRAFT_1299458 [Suillus subaureus]
MEVLAMAATIESPSANNMNAKRWPDFNGRERMLIYICIGNTSQMRDAALQWGCWGCDGMRRVATCAEGLEAYLWGKLTRKNAVSNLFVLKSDMQGFRTKGFDSLINIYDGRATIEETPTLDHPSAARNARGDKQLWRARRCRAERTPGNGGSPESASDQLYFEHQIAATVENAGGPLVMFLAPHEPT